MKEILTKERYRQILIRQIIRPFAPQLHAGDNFFQHGNDSKYTAHILKHYLRNQQIETLEWAPQSPDLNPLENLCAELNRKLNNVLAKMRKNCFNV